MPTARRISLLSAKLLDAYRRFSPGNDERVRLLKIILASGCFAGLLLSARLWLSARDYPLTPVTEKLPAVPQPLDYVLFISLLVLLILIAAAARPFKYAAAFLLVALFLCLSDQSRWQPWFYQYLFMLAAVCFYSREGSDARQQKALLNACRMIVVGVYFWSGVQKLNFNFVGEVFPSLVNPYFNFIFGARDLLPRWLIISVPLLEIALAVGLLTRKFRDASVLAAVLTHVFILSLFIPVRRNSVVWPWNAAMSGFAVALFWRAKDFSTRDILLPKKQGFQTAVVVLFGLMPLVSFFGLWDSYLSSANYSGNTAFAVIHVDEAAKARLPPGMRRHVQPNRAGDKLTLSLHRWSLAEMNVPLYPERRVFMSVARRICEAAGGPPEISLTIYERPGWLDGRRERRDYQCPDL
jgi:uncharacterized membrane protein YbaN (DUF454 family)